MKAIDATYSEILDKDVAALKAITAFQARVTGYGQPLSANARPVAARAAEPEADARPVEVKEMPKVAPKRAAGGARRMQTQLATAIREDTEWKEF